MVYIEIIILYKAIIAFFVASTSAWKILVKFGWQIARDVKILGV